MRRSRDVPAGSYFHYISEWQILSEWRNLQGYEFVVLAAVQWHPSSLPPCRRRNTAHAGILPSYRHFSHRHALLFTSEGVYKHWFIFSHSEADIMNAEQVLFYKKRIWNSQHVSSLKDSDIWGPRVSEYPAWADDRFAGICQTNVFHITNVNTFLHTYVKFQTH